MRHLRKKENFFYDSWIKLVEIEGYDKIAEHFLYNGFSFCGAKPFKYYMLKSDNPGKLLEEFFNGNLYGKDTGITFRLVAHLLALFLNDGNNPQIVSRLIEKFPSACRNKEGKQTGTAVKTMEKYFFGELKPEITFVPLAELSIDPKIKKSFYDIMMSIISDIETEIFDIPSVSKVKDWLTDHQSNNLNNKDNLPGKNNLTSETKQSGIKESINDKPSKIIADVLSTVIKIENENSKYKEELFRVNKILCEERENLKSAQQRIEELILNVNSLKNEIKSKNELLESKEVEISDHLKMNRMLENEQTHQADVALKKIASQLKVEYQNFQTALPMSMSSDLGENLRSQLKRIFAVLERSGMNFN